MVVSTITHISSTMHFLSLQAQFGALNLGDIGNCRCVPLDESHAAADTSPGPQVLPMPGIDSN